MYNVIATPHALGWSDEQWMNKWDENLNQVQRIIHGEIPAGLVNHEVLDTSVFKEKLKRGKRLNKYALRKWYTHL